MGSAHDKFVEVRAPQWNELRALIDKAKGSPKKLTEAELLAIGDRYRSVTSDLAMARRRFPGDPIVRDLSDLVGRSRGLVYDRAPRSFSLKDFVTKRYWRRVRERPRLLLTSTLLLIVPGIIVFIWAVKDPQGVVRALGDRFSAGRETYDDLGYSVSQQGSIATNIFINNIRVSFMAFAMGLTCCVGTGGLLIFNGALLGVVAGLATSAGHGDVAFTLIVAHGVLELSIIIVAAMAGMRMGWALVDPGLRTRGAALREEALAAIEIVIGTLPLFILAGLIEGFFTPAGFGPVWAGVVGVFFGACYWALVFILGRDRATT